MIFIPLWIPFGILSGSITYSFIDLSWNAIGDMALPTRICFIVLSALGGPFAGLVAVFFYLFAKAYSIGSDHTKVTKEEDGS